jgi:hypothetical protein
VLLTVILQLTLIDVPFLQAFLKAKPLPFLCLADAYACSRGEREVDRAMPTACWKIGVKQESTGLK